MQNLKVFLIALIVILMCVATWFAYTADYKYTGDIASLQKAIDNQLAITESPSFRRSLNIEILELLETEQGIVAFVRHRTREQSFGFALFDRGPNRRYQLTGWTLNGFIPYTNFVLVDPFVLSRWTEGGFCTGEQILIAGFNVEEIYEFGVRFTPTVNGAIQDEYGEWQRLFIGEAVFPVERGQFLIKKSREELFELAGIDEPEEPEDWRHSVFALAYNIASLYNRAGEDITAQFELPLRQAASDGGGIGRLPPTGRVFMILLVGAVLVRLVIKPPVRSRSLQTQQSQNIEPSANQAFEPEADPLDKEKS